MNTRKFTLSVIIITKNEEDRIRKCLDSLAGLYDELIVFDSGSTDKTVGIVREYTEKIFITDWPGYGRELCPKRRVSGFYQLMRMRH